MPTLKGFASATVGSARNSSAASSRRLTARMLVGLLVTLRPRDRPPTPPGKDADPKEYPWYFEWSRTLPGGDRWPPISGAALRGGPLGFTQSMRALGRPPGRPSRRCDR